MKKIKNKGGLVDFSTPSAAALKIKIDKHIKDFVNSVHSERLLRFLDDELEYAVFGVFLIQTKEGDAPSSNSIQEALANHGIRVDRRRIVEILQKWNHKKQVNPTKTKKGIHYTICS